MTAALLVDPARGTTEVLPGPALLSGLAEGPGLNVHERRHGALPRMGAEELVRLTEAVGVTGRGGAGFPFARKVAAAAGRRGRPVVVVNLGEGEPASHKDAALIRVTPHLVLDGAALTAGALGGTEVHLVLPAGSPQVEHAVRTALEERAVSGRDRRLRWRLHEATDAFVAGQSSAVLELMAGRENLPVTSWRPSAESGHRRRPTLLSNAETFAQVGRLALVGVAEYCRHGTPAEPGTTLLTLDGDGVAGRPPVVVEVPFGTPWSRVLGTERMAVPVLLGGYHGTWAAAGGLAGLSVSGRELTEAGLGLGAGVVLPLDTGCPVEHTSRLTSYLASQSARRCGPCLNGLPALASALAAVAYGTGGIDEVERLGDLVDGRGACAHPDGTVRLVRSLMTAFPDELRRHRFGGCGYRAGAHARPRRTQVPA